MTAMQIYKFIFALCLLIIVPNLARGQDVRGQDHPVITRCPGQTITRYDVKEFDQFDTPLRKRRGFLDR